MLPESLTLLFLFFFPTTPTVWISHCHYAMVNEPTLLKTADCRNSERPSFQYDRLDHRERNVGRTDMFKTQRRDRHMVVDGGDLIWWGFLISAPCFPLVAYYVLGFQRTCIRRSPRVNSLLGSKLTESSI